ncbi:ABC transporter permease [Enterovirga rhinocerotis]|uniref:NitT/TauT family transport system permease protein n=1 Tax=Enterovirga rhinocerotis TaxID=1339210 RepID=A0A4R7BT21_9HYPH|nr:ABC transporter permease [Enterovirga rhinocerotis]TDR88878.1 NitT/TauT family transport system permease protein [Enterovirga rhinocerotis]
MSAALSDTAAPAGGEAAPPAQAGGTSPGSGLLQVALALVLPVAILVAWHLATEGRTYSLIPSPSAVAVALYDLAFGGINDDAFSASLLTHVLASVGRVYGGFALAVLAALPIGLLIGRVPLVRQMLDPMLQILRPIPVTAWLPLAMIMFGIGPRSAFFLVFLGAFYPVLINTVFGVRSVEPRLFEAASMLGCRGSAQFVKVVLPAAMPAIFTGLRLGLGFAWVVIVIGEMTGVPTGLGALIMEARQLSRTEIVICGMIAIGVAGFISDRLVTLLGRRLLAWSPNHG